MKLALLGTGMIVCDMLPMLVKSRPEKVYIFSSARSLEKAKSLCAQYGLDAVFTDYDAVLASDADTVYVGLPNHLHYEYAKKALNAGKHVISEKPIVPRISELEELAALAKEKKRILIEAISTVHQPAFYALKEKMPLIGDVKLISFNIGRCSSRYDAFTVGELPAAFDPEKAGGALLDLNVYNISTVMGLFGKPLDVKYFPNIDRGIDTSGVLIMDYGTFKATLCASKDSGAPFACFIQGNKGCFHSTDPANMLRSFSFIPRSGDTECFEFADEHRMAAEFRRFEDIIDNLKFEEAEKLLAASAAVCSVMEKARKEAGIIFDGD